MKFIVVAVVAAAVGADPVPCEYLPFQPLSHVLPLVLSFSCFGPAIVFQSTWLLEPIVCMLLRLEREWTLCTLVIPTVYRCSTFLEPQVFALVRPREQT